MPTRLALFLLAAGCLNPKPADTGDDDSDASGGAGGIYDINDGTIAPGEIVTLEGVVVSSPYKRDNKGFFIAEPDGGAGSGLYVWGPDAVAALQIDNALAQGKEITITGEVQDYKGWLELVIGNADDVQITGDGTVPAPVDLGDGAGVDWSLYESTLVTLSDQGIVSMDQYSTAMLTSGVELDDGFQYLEHDCGGHYDAVTGIVFFSYGEYSVNPRGDDDLSGYSAGDSSTATVHGIQADGACGTVELSGLVVTSAVAVDGDDSTVFVQDAGGGEYSGIAVFLPAGTLDLQIGDVIDVTGSVSEYYGFTEVFVADAADVVVTGSATPVADALTTGPADWEAWEGCLVTLEGVSVTGDVTDYGQYPTSYDILLDDMFYDVTASNGDTYASATGLVYYSYEAWNLEPRTASDLVAD